MGWFKRNKVSEKELIDRELEIYKKERIVVIDREVAEQKQKLITYREKVNKEIKELAIQCAEDTKNLEHKYHSNQEQLGIEIAKLEAKKENLEEILNGNKNHYEEIIKLKDDEIKRLNKIVSLMVESQYEDA